MGPVLIIRCAIGRGDGAVGVATCCLPTLTPVSWFRSDIGWGHTVEDCSVSIVVGDILTVLVVRHGIYQRYPGLVLLQRVVLWMPLVSWMM